jgi:type II secretory pathway component GspD/PulD (secretin)
MEAIRNLLARLDIPSKRVLIETRLLETSRIRALSRHRWSGFNLGTKFTLAAAPGTITTGEGQRRHSALAATVAGASRRNHQTDLTTFIGSGGISRTRCGVPSGQPSSMPTGLAVLSFLNSDNDTESARHARAVTVDKRPRGR